MSLTENIPLLIPILIIMLYLISFETITTIAYTMVGRLLAIMIIVYYTHIDMLLGFIILLMIMYYYGREEYEFLLNMDEDSKWKMIFP
tara:strand:+ start:255 stop:518 length:264 start_codon:yes stop_codon:yes gene_type:complete